MADQTMVAVTSSSVPYLYDLPHILSLPEGFEARFRYFVDWVSPDVASAADRGDSLAGRELILVFHSLETSRLLPFRRAEVIELKRRGPMYHLRFIVRGFPTVGADLVVDSDRDAARERDSSWLTMKGVSLVGLKDYPLSEPLPKHVFLQQGRPGWSTLCRHEGISVSSDTRADRQWAAMASLVMMEEKLRDVPLFYLDGPVDRAGNTVAPETMKNHFAPGNRSGSGFKLISGRRYRFQLLQWHGSGDPEVPKTHRVVCKTDPVTVALEGNSNLVLGKYDLLEFAIRAEAPGYSEMSLQVESTLNADSDRDRLWPHLYSVRIPIEVGRDWCRTTFIMLLALVGLGLYAFPMTPLAPQWVDEAVTTLAQLVGLGCLFAAYGGFLSGYVRFASQAGGLAPSPGGGEG